MKNQPKIFRRNTFKDVIFFLGFLVFAAVAYSGLEKNPLMGFLCISFFGLGAVMFLIQLLTNTAYLKLDEEGFEEKSLFRIKSYKWSDVKDFRQVDFRGNKSISFDYTNEYNEWKSRKKPSKLLYGKKNAVTSNYNIKTEELLNLMKDYKRKSK